MTEDADGGGTIINLAERRESRDAAEASSSVTAGSQERERPRTWRGMQLDRLREEGRIADNVLKRVKRANLERDDPQRIRERENQAQRDWLEQFKSGTSKPGILLVEPTPGLRRKFKETLEAEGFDVHVPKQCDLPSVTKLPGVNGRIKDKNTPYDLIVFGERSQPEKDRPDDKAYRLLLNNRFSVPVLFIGCNPSVEQAIDGSRAEENRAYAYNQKPFKTYIDRSAFYSELGNAPLSSDTRSQFLGGVISLLTKNHTHTPENFSRA